MQKEIDGLIEAVMETAMENVKGLRRGTLVNHYYEDCLYVDLMQPCLVLGNEIVWQDNRSDIDHPHAENNLAYVMMKDDPKGTMFPCSGDTIDFNDEVELDGDGACPAEEDDEDEEND